MSAIFCSFSLGCFTMQSPSGKQGIDFEDSEHFGPSEVNMRTGALSPIGEKSWFWAAHSAWVKAGRPVKSDARNTPNGPLNICVMEAIDA